jgi:hypothetical protein
MSVYVTPPTQAGRQCGEDGQLLAIPEPFWPCHVGVRQGGAHRGAAPQLR